MAAAGPGVSKGAEKSEVTDGGTGDIVLGIFVMLLCLAFLLGSIGLPDSPYEPLGPASFPRGIAVILAILATIVLIRGARLRGAGAAVGSRLTWSKGASLAVGTYGLTILFGFALSSGLIGYRLSSIVFLFVAMMLLAGARKSTLPIALVLAMVLGLGTHYVFTSIFVVDLP